MIRTTALSALSARHAARRIVSVREPRHQRLGGCRSGGCTGLGKARHDLVVERTADVDERACRRARLLEQRAVRAQARELQVGQAGLSRAEQLPFAADLEIFLRELETVR